MLGRTHIAAGAAAALIVLQPDTLASCAIAVAGGAVGGMLPDYDKPDGQRKKNVLIGTVILALLLAVQLGVDAVTQLGVVQLLLASTSRASLVGAAAFLGITLFGVITKHRSFTHSLAYAAAMGIATGIACSALVLPLVIGIVSHLVLDTLNHQGEALLWPLPRRFSLGICKSDGLVNNILGVASLCLASGYVAILFYTAANSGVPLT